MPQRHGAHVRVIEHQPERGVAACLIAAVIKLVERIAKRFIGIVVARRAKPPCWIDAAGCARRHERFEAVGFQRDPALFDAQQPGSVFVHVQRV